jgi:hypothetical protein
MNITNEESTLEQYAIISYSRSDLNAVKAELKEFDNQNVCYWYDERMNDGIGYDTQFRNTLHNNNCKGIIFFLSDSFLLSDPCAEEMREFKDKYGVENPNKFCLFILPEGYPRKDENKILEKVNQYVEENKDNVKIQERAKNLKEHIGLFLELNRNGKVNSVVIGNKNNYIDKSCEDGLFYEAGITFGHKRLSNEILGSFPQLQELDDDERQRQREFDKKLAHYAPIEWIVIKENEQTQTLLSKKLLFAVDYLNLKYPFIETDKTLEDKIKESFMEHFEPEDNDKGKIKKETMRFLSERELQYLLKRNQKNLEKKYEILQPKATFFAQTSDVKDAPAFWLAGDINDARWVDAATESLSEQKVGTELYYVRVVVDIEKNN